jgi:hypothetical protein
VGGQNFLHTFTASIALFPDDVTMLPDDGPVEPPRS